MSKIDNKKLGGSCAFATENDSIMLPDEWFMSKNQSPFTVRKYPTDSHDVAIFKQLR